VLAGENSCGKKIVKSSDVNSLYKPIENASKRERNDSPEKHYSGSEKSWPETR